MFIFKTEPFLRALRVSHSYPKQVWVYLKQDFVYTVLVLLLSAMCSVYCKQSKPQIASLLHGQIIVECSLGLLQRLHSLITVINWSCHCTYYRHCYPSPYILSANTYRPSLYPSWNWITKPFVQTKWPLGARIATGARSLCISIRWMLQPQRKPGLGSSGMVESTVAIKRLYPFVFNVSQCSHDLLLRLYSKGIKNTIFENDRKLALDYCRVNLTTS